MSNYSYSSVIVGDIFPNTMLQVPMHIGDHLTTFSFLTVLQVSNLKFGCMSGFKYNYL